jgi:hypothetical protein
MAAARSGRSWHVPASADTDQLAEQQTLNLRAHRSRCRIPMALQMITICASLRA